MESKLIECVQENGKLYSAMRVGPFELRPWTGGEVIVARPKSSSNCMEGEGDLATGAGMI